ncbi:MAG: hypothetical protein WB699_09690 [Bacteroidota bacterium]
MRRTILYTLFGIGLFFPHLGYGAFERIPIGGRSQALCGASQILRGDMFSVEANPASARFCEGLSAGVSITPGLFGMQELRRIDAVITAGLFGGQVSVLGRSFGYEIYRETSAMGAFAMDLDERITVGASATWYFLRVQGYGQAGTIGVNLGASYKLADQVRYGISLRNLNQPTFGRSHEPVTPEILTCLEFLPAPSFLLAASMTKELDSPLEFSLGAEWIIEDHVIVRGGAREGLEQFALGVGFALSGFALDYAVAIHTELGLTHHFTLTFRVM